MKNIKEAKKAHMIFPLRAEAFSSFWKADLTVVISKCG